MSRVVVASQIVSRKKNAFNSSSHIKDETENSYRNFWASTIVKFCDIVFPRDLANENRSLIRRYQSQVVGPFLNIGEHCTIEAATVMERLGRFMRREAKCKDAKQLLLLAEKIFSSVVGKGIHAKLGCNYANQGRLIEAVELQRKTLAVQIQLPARKRAS